MDTNDWYKDWYRAMWERYNGAWSGESLFWTINFVAERNDKNQIYQAQMGGDTDRVYVEHS